MLRIFKDIIAMFVYLLFGAMEIIVLFGMLLFAFGAPILVVNYYGAETGDSSMTIALFIGVVLAVAWYFYLDNGGKEKIQKLFRRITHRTIRRLGVGDAIYDD